MTRTSILHTLLTPWRAAFFNHIQSFIPPSSTWGWWDLCQNGWGLGEFPRWLGMAKRGGVTKAGGSRISISQVKFKSRRWKCFSLGIQSMDVCLCLYPFPKSNSKVGGESVSPLAFSPWMSVSISQIKFKSGWWKCLSLGIQSMDVCIPFPSQIQKWEVKVFLSWHLAHGCLYPFPKLNSKVGGGG